MNLATSEIFIEQSGSVQHEATCFSISLAVVVVDDVVVVVDDDVVVVVVDDVVVDDDVD